MRDGLFIAVVLSLSLLACVRAETDADGCERLEHAEFDASAETWKQLVADNGDTYYYRLEAAGYTGLDEEPPDGGCISNYTVQVTDGQVTRRIEEGDALGTHDAPLQPWTMDQHYSLCCETVLAQDPDDNGLYFSTFDNGVMRSCSYAPWSCAELCGTASDDYPHGIRFTEFGFGQPS